MKSLLALVSALVVVALLAPTAGAAEVGATVGCQLGGCRVATFAVETPATPLSGPASITGMAPGETPVAIDFRPSSGDLYMLGRYAATGSGHLYRLDQVTGAATDVGPAITLAGDEWDVDFDPVGDKLRALGYSFAAAKTLNFRLDPDSGLVMLGSDGTPDFLLGDPDYSPSSQAEVGAGAYTDSRSGATETTMYALSRDRLALMGSPGGTPYPASSGRLTAVGTFSQGDASAPVEGLDISGATGRAYALLVGDSPTARELVEMRLSDAATTPLGQLPVKFPSDLAISPTSRLGLATAATAVSEGETALLTVGRQGPGTGPADVAWQLVPQTASAADAAAASGTLSFGAGETEKQLAVPIVDDPLAEGAETFAVQLVSADGGPRGGAVLDGSTEASVTIGSSDPDAAPAGAAAITELRVVPGRMRLGRSLPRLARSVSSGQIRFRLSDDATVALGFARAVPGRRVGGRCVRPRSGAERRCTRYVRLKGAIRVRGRKGLNLVRFQGRLSRRRSLAPGRYRLTATVPGTSGRPSAAPSVRFTLLARRTG